MLRCLQASRLQNVVMFRLARMKPTIWSPVLQGRCGARVRSRSALRKAFVRRLVYNTVSGSSPISRNPAEEDRCCAARPDEKSAAIRMRNCRQRRGGRSARPHRHPHGRETTNSCAPNRQANHLAEVASRIDWSRTCPARLLYRPPRGLSTMSALASLAASRSSRRVPIGQKKARPAGQALVPSNLNSSLGSQTFDLNGKGSPWKVLTRLMSVADEMSGFVSRRSVRFLEVFKTGGSGCDPRYGWRGMSRHWRGAVAPCPSLQ